MLKVLTAAEMESLVKSSWFSMADVLRVSGVARSSYQRWRNGADLKISSYSRLCEAINVLAMKGNA